MAKRKGEGPDLTIENDPDILFRASGAVDPSEGVPPPAPPRRVLRKGDMTALPNEATPGEPVHIMVAPGGGLVDTQYVTEANPEEDEWGFEGASENLEVGYVPPHPNAATPQREPVNGVNPGVHDQVPSQEALAIRERRRNVGSVVVEIDHEMHHRERRVSQNYHIVTSDPKKRMPVGTGFANGIPLTIFGVPTETGRRYRITVEETAESLPAPKRVPWGGNQTV